MRVSRAEEEFLWIESRQQLVELVTHLCDDRAGDETDVAGNHDRLVQRLFAFARLQGHRRRLERRIDCGPDPRVHLTLQRDRTIVGNARDGGAHQQLGRRSRARPTRNHPGYQRRGTATCTSHDPPVLTEGRFETSPSEDNLPKTELQVQDRDTHKSPRDPRWPGNVTTRIWGCQFQRTLAGVVFPGVTDKLEGLKQSHMQTNNAGEWR